MHALHGVKQLVHTGSLTRNLVGSEIGHYRVSQLGGPPNAFAGKQRKHCVGIVMGDPALLPFLNGPRGFAYVIDRIAEIHEDALVNPSASNGMLELQEFCTGFLELEINAPKGLARDKQLDRNSDYLTFFAADGHHASAIGFPRKQVGQFKLAPHAREIRHVQKAALRVHLARLRIFDDNAAGSFLPFGLYGNNYGKAAAAALICFWSGWRIDEFFHAGTLTAKLSVSVPLWNSSKTRYMFHSVTPEKKTGAVNNTDVSASPFTTTATNLGQSYSTTMTRMRTPGCRTW